MEHVDSHHDADGLVLKTNNNNSLDTQTYEIECLTNEQLTRIKKLPRESDSISKWKKIYRIIFPGEDTVQATYVPSVHALRQHAFNPPEWLFVAFTNRCGDSRAETDLFLKKFLVYYDIVCCKAPQPASPALTQHGYSVTDSSLFEDEGMLDPALMLSFTQGFDPPLCQSDLFIHTLEDTRPTEESGGFDFSFTDS